MNNTVFKESTNNGFSLIETLIAIALFAIVSVIATQSLAAVLKNSRKSESISKARENVDYAISTMERLLRNAQDIDPLQCTSTQIVYKDEYNNMTSFKCLGGANGYIASGAGNLRLTSDSVKVDCTGATVIFSCPAIAVGVPKTVMITVKAEDANLGSGAEGTTVTSKTKVNLRNYDLN